MKHQDPLSDHSDPAHGLAQRVAGAGNDFELGLFLHLAVKSLIWCALFIIIAILGSYIYLHYAPTCLPIEFGSANCSIKQGSTHFASR